MPWHTFIRTRIAACDCSGSSASAAVRRDIQLRKARARANAPSTKLLRHGRGLRDHAAAWNQLLLLESRAPAKNVLDAEGIEAAQGRPPATQSAQAKEPCNQHHNSSGGNDADDSWGENAGKRGVRTDHVAAVAAIQRAIHRAQPRARREPHALLRPVKHDGV